jgi:hypothetical protein
MMARFVGPVSIGALYLSVACAKAQSGSYFPIAPVGTTYEYSWEMAAPGLPDVQRLTMVQRTEGEETIRGHRYFRVVTVVSGMAGFRPQTSFLRTSADGVYSTRGQADSSEYRLFPLPIMPGTAWTVTNAADGRTDYRVVSQESLQLADRTYPDCLKISATTTTPGGTLTATQYYAKGVGLVKATVVADGVTTEMVLQRVRS